MPQLAPFFSDLLDPHFAWGHLPYALLVASMLMRKMVWLRVLAIAAGLSRIVVRGFIVYDPVSVVWEIVLVLVNLGQLLLIWWANRQRSSSDDERLLIARLLPGSSRRTAHRLLREARWSTVPPGTVLAREGEAVAELMFVAGGFARIEKGGELVAVCRRGDFVGEMSFVVGGGATATVTAEEEMRIAAFRQTKLRDLVERDPEVRRAMDSSFNHNLIEKLARAGAASRSATPT